MDDIKIVRLATHADENGVVDLCRLAAEESQAFPMSEQRVREKLRKAFNRQLAICGVIGAPGDIQGAIFLELGCLWYSDAWGVHELFNIVHPDHRRSDYAKVLIEFGKQCSMSLMLPLEIGVLSTSRTEAKIRLYQRKLGKPAGAFFIYNAGSIRNG